MKKLHRHYILLMVIWFHALSVGAAENVIAVTSANAQVLVGSWEGPFEIRSRGDGKELYDQDTVSLQVRDSGGLVPVFFLKKSNRSFDSTMNLDGGKIIMPFGFGPRSFTLVENDGVYFLKTSYDGVTRGTPWTATVLLKKR
jgi:hypothetical protein